jgi:hypothetical protein
MNVEKTGITQKKQYEKECNNYDRSRNGFIIFI